MHVSEQKTFGSTYLAPSSSADAAESTVGPAASPIGQGAIPGPLVEQPTVPVAVFIREVALRLAREGDAPTGGRSRLVCVCVCLH